mmetsp:Transcript_52844/g.113214  ORF Transcript_52844/g.113214 Transcript_52844/m.113214 type:complete len:274 (-) Transcript_52844:135-956(-)
MELFNDDGHRRKLGLVSIQEHRADVMRGICCVVAVDDSSHVDLFQIIARLVAVCLGIQHRSTELHHLVDTRLATPHRVLHALEAHTEGERGSEIEQFTHRPSFLLCIDDCVDGANETFRKLPRLGHAWQLQVGLVYNDEMLQRGMVCAVLQKKAFLQVLQVRLLDICIAIEIVQQAIISGLRVRVIAQARDHTQPRGERFVKKASVILPWIIAIEADDVGTEALHGGQVASTPTSPERFRLFCHEVVERDVPKALERHRAIRDTFEHLLRHGQ